MIVSARMPREALLAHAGIMPVATKNNGDPTSGRVPLRMTEDVLKEMSRPRYANTKVRNFHRYASVDLVGSFESAGGAAGATPAAERRIRLNPAPGVTLREPVSTTQQRDVYLAGVYWLGTVMTHWDATSRSIINETTPNHEMRDGFVIRQVTALDRNIYVMTYGEGVNVGPLHAWTNGTFGPNPFFGMDQQVNDRLAGLPGFRTIAFPGVPGSVDAYQSGDQVLIFP